MVKKLDELENRIEDVQLTISGAISGVEAIGRMCGDNNTVEDLCQLRDLLPMMSLGMATALKDVSEKLNKVVREMIELENGGTN